jgi:hypothetical protein
MTFTRFTLAVLLISSIMGLLPYDAMTIERNLAK